MGTGSFCSNKFCFVFLYELSCIKKLAGYTQQWPEQTEEKPVQSEMFQFVVLAG